MNCILHSGLAPQNDLQLEALHKCVLALNVDYTGIEKNPGKKLIDAIASNLNISNSQNGSLLQSGWNIEAQCPALWKLLGEADLQDCRNDRLDLVYFDSSRLIIVEADRCRADQLAKKAMSRFAQIHRWGRSRIKIDYVAVLYYSQSYHDYLEDSRKYLTYCESIGSKVFSNLSFRFWGYLPPSQPPLPKTKT